MQVYTSLQCPDLQVIRKSNAFFFFLIKILKQWLKSWLLQPGIKYQNLMSKVCVTFPSERNLPVCQTVSEGQVILLSALSARILNSLTHLKSFVLSLTPTSPLCSVPIKLWKGRGQSLCCSCLCHSGPRSPAAFHLLSLKSTRLLIPSLQKEYCSNQFQGVPDPYNQHSHN